MELPVTISTVNESGTAAQTDRTENVQVIPPYLGHIVTVVSYQAGEISLLGTAPVKITADNQHAAESEVPLEVSTSPSPIPAGVRINVDTAVPPGLYDDLLLTGLRLESPGNSKVGERGFRV